MAFANLNPETGFDYTVVIVTDAVKDDDGEDQLSYEWIDCSSEKELTPQEVYDLAMSDGDMPRYPNGWGTADESDQDYYVLHIKDNTTGIKTEKEYHVETHELRENSKYNE